MKLHERARSLWRSPLLLGRLLAAGRYDFVYDRMPISLRAMPWAKRLNLIRSGLNLLHRRIRPWGMPLHMQFELTSYCNLRCPVCPTGTDVLERKATAMDPELFRRVFSEVGPYLLTASLWGWGESLLHPKLDQILETASQHDVVTLLSTNGQNLDREEIIEILLAFPPSQLIVAIDGLTDETNTRFRVGARLEPALRGVRRLAELKRQRGLRLPILHMRFMAMNHNEHELPRLPTFVEENGFDMYSIRALSIIDSQPAVQAHSDLIPADTLFRAYDYDDGQRRRKNDYICLQPFWFPSVFADGTLVGCEQDFSAAANSGLIDERTSFRELWYGQRAKRLRRTVRNNLDAHSFCRQCPARDRDTTDTSVRAGFLNPQLCNPLIIGNGPHG